MYSKQVEPCMGLGMLGRPPPLQLLVGAAMLMAMLPAGPRTAYMYGCMCSYNLEIVVRARTAVQSYEYSSAYS
eukprot:COSAG01_NODE_25530_length_741_cov_15.348910_2_plen_73_part_00